MFLKSWPAVYLLAAALLAASPVFAQSIQQAQELQSHGDWKAAEDAWRALIQQSPQDYRLWTSLGITLSHQNRYNDAIEAYRKALAIQPKDPQTESQLGITYFKARKLPQAIPPLRSEPAALGDNPQIDTLMRMRLLGTRT